MTPHAALLPTGGVVGYGALSGGSAVGLTPSGRLPARFLTAGLAIAAGFSAWYAVLGNPDAPVVALSWADAASGVCALVVTALVLARAVAPGERARRVIGIAAPAAAVDLLVL